MTHTRIQPNKKKNKIWQHTLNRDNVGNCFMRIVLMSNRVAHVHAGHIHRHVIGDETFMWIVGP